MPDYSKGKIYKLQCDDGYYYIGSSVNELRKRFAEHKKDSKTISSRVYQHINTIGWNQVRIVLVEEYSCENREQLTRKEDEHIRIHKDDPLCLNMKCASQTPEQYTERKKQYYEQNKEYISEQGKQYREQNAEHITERKKQYYEQNKEQVLESKKQYYEVNKERIKQRERLHYQNKKLSLTTNAYNTDKGADASGITKE